MPKTILPVCLSCALVLLTGSFGPSVAATCNTISLYANDFESGSGLDGWTTGFLFGNQSATNDWRGIQACEAHSESYVFRFGGETETCDGDYTDDQVSDAESPALQVPADSTTTRLSVWHRRDFEDGKDGGRLAVKVDGSSIFTLVEDAQIVSGATHNGALAGGCGSTVPYSGLPVFTGTTSEFEETVVDLDAVCDAATSGTGGCAGHTINIGFLSFTDCSFGGDGWFLDDVQVTACEPPSPSDYFTVTPCRLVDTRNTDEPLQPDTLQVFALTGSCGIPATAKAAAVNVTAVQTGAAGHIRIWPTDVEGTDASLLNFAAGQTRANNALLALPSDSSGGVNVLATTDAPLHFLIDVVGYFE
jgi:hypothetical protein